MQGFPLSGPRQGKIWGLTQLGFFHNSIEAHAIHVKKGGFCSCHTHKHKWNRFFVLQGKMAVRIFGDGSEVIDETVISVGQITDVPCGVRHEFEALEDTIAVEFYWSPLDSNDIDRMGSTGGIR